MARTSIILFFLLAAFLPQILGAQVDSIYSTDSVFVHASRLLSNSDAQITKVEINTINPQYNLSDILKNETGIIVKSYGLGSLATVSLRGTYAAHTSVLWNGINLQSPMNGTVDLALIPSELIGNVSLHSGGNSGSWGSGAIGGSILLSNTFMRRVANKKWSQELSYTFGDFEENRIGVSSQYKNNKLKSSLRLFYNQAQNNFKFINITKRTQPIEKQTNAGVLQYGLVQENTWKIPSKHEKNQQEITSNIWYQHNDRQIPPSMSVASSHARQIDDFLRIHAKWQLTSDKNKRSANIAFFKESLIYQDTSIRLYSDNQSYSFFSELEQNMRLGKANTLNIGLKYSYIFANTTNYAFSPKHHKVATFIYHTWKHNAWKSDMSLRLAYIYPNLIVPTGAAGMHYSLKKEWKLFGRLTRNYRTPTFNDLYWGNQGNPNLKPEVGWTQEMGFQYSKNTNTLNLLWKFTVFSLEMQDLILWKPPEWKPVNLSEIWSRGIENHISIGYKWLNWKTKIALHYHFTKSTNEEVNSPITLHKQLIYIPLHSAGAIFLLSYKDYEFKYQHSNSSKRYTSTDNGLFVIGYHIGNIELSKKVDFKKCGGSLIFELRNVWNHSYQTIAYYPMPLRNFRIKGQIYF